MLTCQTTVGTVSVPIDVQGYIYWDVPHVEDGEPQDSAPSAFVLGYYGTSWEIHPVSAWRLHAS